METVVTWSPLACGQEDGQKQRTCYFRSCLFSSNRDTQNRKCGHRQGEPEGQASVPVLEDGHVPSATGRGARGGRRLRRAGRPPPQNSPQAGAESVEGQPDFKGRNGEPHTAPLPWPFIRSRYRGPRGGVPGKAERKRPRGPCSGLTSQLPELRSRVRPYQRLSSSWSTTPRPFSASRFHRPPSHTRGAGQVSDGNAASRAQFGPTCRTHHLGMSRCLAETCPGVTVLLVTKAPWLLPPWLPGLQVTEGFQIHDAQAAGGTEGEGAALSHEPWDVTASTPSAEMVPPAEGHPPSMLLRVCPPGPNLQLS